MKTREVLEHFKGPKNTAEALSKDGWVISSSAVSLWGEVPPQGRQHQIQNLTKGRLKVSKPVAA